LNTVFRVRKAKASDTEKLARIFLESRLCTFYWQNPAQFHLEDFEKQTAGEVVFVAEDEKGTILGFISVWAEESPPFIHHLYISLEHQKKGIGKLLIQSLFSWLPRPYRLKCLTKNRKALTFYKKTGWVEVDRGRSIDGSYVLLELSENLP
jgi:GNAT superfamily N-acetyltransferase